MRRAVYCSTCFDPPFVHHNHWFTMALHLSRSSSPLSNSDYSPDEEEVEVKAQNGCNPRVIDVGAPVGKGRGKLIKSIIGSKTLTGENFASKTASHSTFITHQFENASEDDGNQNPLLTNWEQLHTMNVYTNFVLLIRRSGYSIYQYQIECSPPLEEVKLMARLASHEKIKSTIGHPAIVIGSQMFMPLRIESFESSLIPHPTLEEKHLCVKVLFVKELPVKEQVFIFNIIFKQIMRDLNHVQMRDKFFDASQHFEMEEHLIEIWPGYVLDVFEYNTDDLILQCDVSHRVLNKINLLKQIEMLLPNHNYQEVARKHFVGQNVVTTYNNRSYRIDDIDFSCNPLSTFLRGNTEMTYVDYFYHHYGITINDVDQPMLVYRKYQLSTRSHVLIYLVPELCFLTGIRSVRDKNVTRKLIEFIQHGPKLRYQKLLKYIEEVNTNPLTSERLYSWGIKLDSAGLNLKANLCKEERIVINTDQQFLKNYRRTNENMRNWSGMLKDSILQPVELKNWFIVVTLKDKPLADNLVRSFRRLSKTMLTSFALPRVVTIECSEMDYYVLAVKNNYETEDQLVVLITPEPYEVKARYDEIKRLCTVQLGIASQFVRACTMLRNNFHTICPNILVQITCKLGGYPWGVAMPMANVMYIGIDIYHKKQVRKTSVFGFVASLNSIATRWYSKTFFKSSTLDLAEPRDVVEAMTEALKRYRSMNGFLPQYIIIFRDDVGLPIPMLISTEFDPIMFAIDQVYENPELSDFIFCKPHVSFLTVAKRISTKLYLMTCEHDGQSVVVENVPTGTIMPLNNINYEQFFLVSQKVAKACCSPVRVRILKNTTDELSGSQLQLISYKLCYLFYNTASVIRQPAPGQYAHKLAYFVGEHLEGNANVDLCDKLYFL